MEKFTPLFAITIVVMSIGLLSSQKNDYFSEKTINETVVLLGQKLKQAGVAQNPTIAHYLSYPSTSGMLYLVTYTDGTSEQKTAVIETANLDGGGSMVYVCRGTECQCKVGVAVGSLGEYIPVCNCSTCVLEGYQIPT